MQGIRSHFKSSLDAVTLTVRMVKIILLNPCLTFPKGMNKVSIPLITLR